MSVQPKSRRASRRSRSVSAPVCLEDAPRLSRSVVRASLDLSRSTAEAKYPETAILQFAEAIRQPLAIPVDALEILRLVDGQRSYRQILELLDAQLEACELLSFAQSMIREGVFEKPKEPTTRSTSRALAAHVPK